MSYPPAANPSGRAGAQARTAFAAAAARLVARIAVGGRGGCGPCGRVLAARPARGDWSDIGPDAGRKGRLLRIAGFCRGALDHIETAGRMRRPGARLEN